MLIVSDTTPIITLMKMGHLDILKQLYGMVLIPNAVYMELTSNEKYAGFYQLLQKFFNLPSLTKL